MKIKIRKAKKGDEVSIAQHNCLMAMETENKTLHAKTVLKGVKAVINDEQKGFYLVAESITLTPYLSPAGERSTTVAGNLMITFEWSDWRNSNIWWIQSVYVKKEFRNKGIYRITFIFWGVICIRQITFQV